MLRFLYKTQLLSLLLFSRQFSESQATNNNRFVTPTEDLVYTRSGKMAGYYTLTMKTLAVILVCVLVMFDAVQAEGCTTYGTFGYVYILKEKNGYYYKIGGTTNPGERISRLQTGNPRKLEYVRGYAADDCLQAEKLAHKSVTPTYNAKLGGGTEWFHVVGNNNHNDFLQRIHHAVLDKKNNFNAYQFWP